MKSKYCYPTDLLRRDIKADCPEVDLLVSVNAGHDEEQAGPLGSPGSEAAQPEDDRPLVLLDHLDAHEEGEGQGGQEEEERDGRQEERADPGTFRVSYNK